MRLFIAFICVMLITSSVEAQTATPTKTQVFTHTNTPTNTRTATWTPSNTPTITQTPTPIFTPPDYPVGGQHVDHRMVSISTTAPLLGGGDITTSRTLSIDPNSFADSLVCATNPWTLTCGISISDQNIATTNRLTVLPNESVTGGSACPDDGSLHIQDRDDTSAEEFAMCLPTGASLAVNRSLIVDAAGYLQFKHITAGAPASTDCDAITEIGRMAIDPNADFVYFCNGSGHSGTAGWGHVVLGF